MRAVLLGVLLALALGAGSAAAAETLRLRADSWCPYNCDPGSDRPGYMVDIAKAVFEPQGITVEYRVLPWTEAVETARSGGAEGVIGATADDAPGFVFGAKALGFSSNILAARKGYRFTYDGVRSLEGQRLAAVRDYSYGEELDAFIAKGGGVRLAEGDNAKMQNIELLLAGTVDLVLEDQNVMEYSLTAAGLTGLLDLHRTGKTTPLHIAFSPANPRSADYARMLDQGVAELRASGRLAEILKRYGLTDWE